MCLWQKIHQDAIKHLDDDYMKNQYINRNSTMDDGSLALITDKGYCISKDLDYNKVNYN